MSLAASWQDPAAMAPDAVRRRAFAAARRHSFRVRVFRVALPLVGLAAVAGLVVLTRLGLPDAFDLSAARLSVTPNAVIMEHPNLTGFDGDEREYAVAAERAVQPLTNPDRVRLESIEATLTVPGQGTATITAGSGDYDHGALTLRLDGNIAVDSTTGYALRMRDADIDFAAGTMRSDNPVTVIYADSEITGQRFEATEGGRRLLFAGGVESTIMPPKREVASGEPEPPE